jgi:hypothetical protein
MYAQSLRRTLSCLYPYQECHCRGRYESVDLCRVKRYGWPPLYAAHR